MSTRRHSSHHHDNDASSLESQAEILKHMLAYIDTMALKCAVELRIADTIHSHGSPITLRHLVSSIPSPSPDVTCLQRVMHVLVRNKIFKVHYDDDGDERYGLNEAASKWLLHDSDQSLVPLFLALTHPLLLSPWHYISRSIKESGPPFEKAHGRSFWEMASVDPDFNKLFNDGMAGYTKTTLKAVVSGYKEEFNNMAGTVVDVGGGTGGVVAEIVKEYPHLKGINYDLPHVVSTAPAWDGVTHVGGDIFKHVPPADAVFVKGVLHDWGDEDCVKILKNCRDAILERKGRAIIVDVVLQPDREGNVEDTRFDMDLTMMALCSGGKERTEAEFKKLLVAAGFPRFRFISLPALPSLIEAFPQ